MLEIDGLQHLLLLDIGMPGLNGFEVCRRLRTAPWARSVPIVAITGLGQILNQAAQDIYPAMILVGMISVALCGWLMTVALGWIEQRVMPWKAQA